ncbi:MAG: Cys-tRNA(Pro) deacylase [Deltaproteobacteria bacterium]|nr:MAG: Cys-tRNA(Pro) deacylase [Deltaproteobacteria bacterium]
MTTRAIAYLKNINTLFEVIKYDHREKGAEFAARATAFPLEQTVKTLVVDIENKNHCLALVPGNRQLDLKKLARVFSVKRAAMADVALAERLTGYHVGGISPFGTRRKLPAVMDESILKYQEIMINAGQRGTMLKMAPQDIIRALDCEVAAVSR